MSGIYSEVEAELLALGVAGWRAKTALTLADFLDAQPNASMARELRSLMVEMGSTATTDISKGDVGDDLAAQRAARIARATGS